MLRWLIALFALVLVTPATLLAANESRAERRVALVIGNNDYQHAKKLDNAVADAQAFRRELETRGFDVVYRENANRRTMNSAMEEFMGKLSTDTWGMIFYSGHGVQINGANYLVPTDLLAKAPSDFAYDAVDLGKLIDRVSKTQAKFSLAVIDACRDNPFQGHGKDIGGTRGLVAPTGDATGVMIVYAAGANQKALDRLDEEDRNPNGLFTREFLKAIRVPGLTVQEAVNQIKATVIAQAKSVGYVQTPAIYDQSVGTFYFTPGKAPAPVAKLEQQTVQQVVQTVDLSVMELEFWNGIKDRNSKDEFSAYLEQYPQGRFAPLARARMLTIARQVSADNAAADKIAADTAAADRATAAKVLADKAAAERVAADKSAAERVSADKAAADTIASDKLAADKLVADKRAAEKATARRKALVIGNYSYVQVRKPETAQADARSVGKTLSELGFDVSLHLDLNERAMKAAVQAFNAKIEGGDDVVFFFAGYGGLGGISSYLLPTDFHSKREAQENNESINLNRILDDMAKKTIGFRLAVIDAALPFRIIVRDHASRDLTATTVAAAEGDVMLLFSDSSAEQSMDRLSPADKDPNSLFTRVLLKEMVKPGVPIKRVIRNIQIEVRRLAESVGRKQSPMLYDQAAGDFFFKP